MSAVERLGRLDACAVSDALDKLGASGTVNDLAPLTGPAKIAGRVVTVKLVAADGTPAKRHLCTAAVEAAQAGDVIVVEHHSRDDCAGWGGILSTAAKAKGVAGTIVDGLARDIDESRERGYPVFARAAIRFLHVRRHRLRPAGGSWRKIGTCPSPLAASMCDPAISSSPIPAVWCS